MPATTLSSREFNQDTARAKRAARKGPVFITDRGKPSLVLLDIEEYQRISASGEAEKKSTDIVELLYMPEAAEIDFEIPKLDIRLKVPDFS